MSLYNCHCGVRVRFVYIDHCGVRVRFVYIDHCGVGVTSQFTLATVVLGSQVSLH